MGKALPLVTARIEVAGYEASRPIAPGDKSVEFLVDLHAGETLLQTYLSDAQGDCHRGVLRARGAPAGRVAPCGVTVR